MSVDSAKPTACMPKAKPRLAWFSCLYGDSRAAADNTKAESAQAAANSESLSAYFSQQMLPLVREKYEIEIFHDSFEPYKDYPTFHYLTAAQRHKQKPFDLFFYQLEDSRASAFCRMHMTLIPGISLLHNFLLVDDGPEPILNSSWSDVLERFKNEQVCWPDREKIFNKEGKAALREAAMCFVPVFSSQKDYGDYLRLSKQKLVSAEEALAFYLGIPVNCGKLAVNLPQAACSAAAQSRKILLFCGSPRVEHRAHCLLAAIARMGESVCLKWLLADSEVEQARKLCAEFDISSFELLGGRSPAKWEAMLAQGDIALHPHFSVFGQTSPYLQMSLMAAKPCIVSDFGASDFLPSSAVFKVPVGHEEVPVLYQTLQYIISHPELAQIAQAREFAIEFFECRSVANQLAYIFEKSMPLLATGMKKWAAFERDARSAILQETRGARAESLNVIAASEDQFLNQAFSDLGWLP